jgi:hypothetical protein
MTAPFYFSAETETIGFLALAFDLVCRNARAYIEANRIKSGIAPIEESPGGYEQYAPLPMRTTRRMNAWQQQQAADDESFWDPRPTRTTRRMNAWQQSNQGWDF